MRLVLTNCERIFGNKRNFERKFFVNLTFLDMKSFSLFHGAINTENTDTENRKCYANSLNICFSACITYMSLHVSGILMDSKFTPSMLFFSCLIFHSISGRNFKKTRHICFFMPCSSKNSCFCFEATKMNIKVLGNYRGPQQQMLVLLTSWVILTVYNNCLVLKTCLHFANEQDLTHII